MFKPERLQSSPQPHYPISSLELQEIAQKHKIQYDILEEAFKSLGEKPEIAENLALYIKNKNIKVVPAFVSDILKEADDLRLAGNLNSLLEAKNLDFNSSLNFQKVLANFGGDPQELISKIKVINSLQNQYLLTFFRLNFIGKVPVSVEKANIFLEVLATETIERRLNEFLTSPNFSEENLKTLLEYHSKLKDRNSHLTINEAFSLMSLNVPLEEVDHLSDEAVLKCNELVKKVPTNFFLKNGYKEKIENYDKCIKEAVNLPHFYFLAATEGAPSFNTDAYKEFPSNIWEHYIVRNSDKQTARDSETKKYYNMDQIAYGNKMHEGTCIGASGIKSGWDSKQLLKFCAYQRKIMAETLKQAKTDTSFGYGLLKCGTVYHTECVKIYKNLGEELRSLHEDWSKNETEFYKVVSIKPGEIEAVFKISLEGKEVELSKLVFQPDLVDVVHTPDENVPLILKEVDRLYDQILVEEDPKTLMELLGKSFWLICQAKPYVAGDPSIAEIYIKALYLHKTGNELPPWKEDLFPWESVMREVDPDRYAEDFHSLFDFKN